jgi:dTDP-4-amino-4,6-dideoxygalactose transaminase
MTTLTWDRHRGHAWSYDVVELGYNYRTDEIRSTIGREQLKKLEKNNASRRSLTALYHQLLNSTVPEIITPFSNYKWNSSNHILPILLPEGTDRAAFAQAMKENGIQTSLHYPPIHQFQYYRENGLSPKEPLPLTEQVAVREVTLPLYGTLDPSAVEIVVNAVKDALRIAQKQDDAKVRAS